MTQQWQCYDGDIQDARGKGTWSRLGRSGKLGAEGSRGYGSDASQVEANFDYLIFIITVFNFRKFNTQVSWACTSQPRTLLLLWEKKVTWGW